MESVNLMIRNIKMRIKRYNAGAKEKVVFLHGFTGSSDTWEEVITYLPTSMDILTVDLIGHGQTSKPNDFGRYYVEEQIEDLHTIFNQLDWTHFTLVGYSMGGRLALAYTAKYPVDKLILESSSPGLESEEERIKRRHSDKMLAASILKDGISAFIEYWESIPLFHSQKSLPLEKQGLIRKERLAGSEIGLSNSLRGFSTGVQPSYWNKLKDMKTSTVLLTGELDLKFYNTAKKMQKLLPNCTHKQVNNVGHAIHVEKPELFATIVEDIILKGD
ncbi:2-succinyl-6-hydroxy-2,4-cyclohexadiene-1-carboxylate synthase [Psychrobacillus sp. FJAT-51614]|uniref:Putative 2-succinyl-6-hydroxy-2,4-cyclohexadiene-1-carboxylate synthase n=1 Tax=Psychrobacillus mangrovi TaxID=3117745 RepID=A0ABU8F2E1_9BACI